MVIGVTSQPQKVPLRVHGSFLHHLQMAAPSQPQREAMLTALARERHVSPEVDFRDLAKRTAGFVLGDFVALYSHAAHLAFRDVINHWWVCGEGKDRPHPAHSSSTNLATYIPAHPPNYIPVHPLIYVPAHPPNYIPAHPPNYIPAHPPTLNNFHSMIL